MNNRFVFHDDLLHFYYIIITSILYYCNITIRFLLKYNISQVNNLISFLDISFFTFPNMEANLKGTL